MYEWINLTFWLSFNLFDLFLALEQQEKTFKTYIEGGNDLFLFNFLGLFWKSPTAHCCEA